MKHDKSTSFSLQTINKRDIAIAIISFSLSLFITISVGEKTYDDTHITFRYAKNLASGQGFVYNSEENYLGTTTPLFTLFLALVKINFPYLEIPSIAQWSTGVALFFLSFFTYLLGRDHKKPIAGIISMLFVLLNPIIILVWGGESILFLSLAAVIFYSYFRGNEVSSAIIIGLAFLTRGEGILLGVVLFTHYIVTHRKFPWHMIIAFWATILPWMIYSFNTFGTFLPGTLQAKTAQIASGVFPPFFITSLDMFRGYVIGSPNFPGIIPHYSYFIITILALVGGISLLIHPRQPLWWSIMAWLVLYSVGYSLIGVPFYHWYSIPLLYGGIILTGLGTQFAHDFANQHLGSVFRNHYQVTFIILSLLVCLPLITGANAVINYSIQPISQAQRLYSKTGLWLKQNTPTTASVGYFEIGFMGYYSDRKFIDPVGLVNPGVSEQVAKRNFKWAYLHYKPDYLVINPVRWYERIGNIRDEYWFSSAYQEVKKIEEDGYFDAPIIIYKKFDETVIPTP